MKKGFTLIELLIVIVIIGVLATAVLSAINPIEQVRKAQDAGMRSDSAELLNAIERYYTSFVRFPWETPAYSASLALPGNAGTQISAGTNWLVNGLVANDELKEEFTARDALTGFRLWHSNDLVRICFQPSSKSYQANAGWSSAGELSAGGLWECVPE